MSTSNTLPKLRQVTITGDTSFTNFGENTVKIAYSVTALEKIPSISYKIALGEIRAGNVTIDGCTHEYIYNKHNFNFYDSSKNTDLLIKDFIDVDSREAKLHLINDITYLVGSYPSRGYMNSTFTCSLTPSPDFQIDISPRVLEKNKTEVRLGGTVYDGGEFNNHIDFIDGLFREGTLFAEGESDLPVNKTLIMDLKGFSEHSTKIMRVLLPPYTTIAPISPKFTPTSTNFVFNCTATVKKPIKNENISTLLPTGAISSPISSPISSSSISSSDAINQGDIIQNDEDEDDAYIITEHLLRDVRVSGFVTKTQIAFSFPFILERNDNLVIICEETPIHRIFPSVLPALISTRTDDTHYIGSMVVKLRNSGITATLSGVMKMFVTISTLATLIAYIF